MDGNGRWAKSHGLPRTAGHKKGAERVKEIVRAAKGFGVKALTIFAFSTENWNRSNTEIKMLFTYLNFFLSSYKNELVRDGIKLNVIGRRDRLDKGSIKVIEDVEDATAKNKDFVFNICIDYGGRWDIVEAAKKIINDCREKKCSDEDINEKTFAKYLQLKDQPDPDLLIRTSGEQRISNFLLWNLAYSEFYFPGLPWPDFTTAEMKKAIEVYSSRERRFGKI